MQQEVDEVLNAAVRDGTVPGVSGMVVDGDGILYRGNHGMANTAAGTLLASDSIFRISSWTKSVTTTALMQLAESGQVDVDAPVASIIPEFARIQVLEGFEGNEPKLRRPRHPVTVAQLATHTSGLAYDIWSEKLLNYQDRTTAPGVLSGTRESLFLPMMTDPGTEWAYSPGIDWIGEIVEKVSGTRIDQYLHDNIFAPLGMSSTGFSVPQAKHGKLVAVHTREPDRSFTATDFSWTPTGDHILSGHGLYSTVEDYMVFLQVFLNGGMVKGTRILRPETLRLMGENRIGEINVSLMRSARPTLSKDAELFRGMIKKHSLGFQITTEESPGTRSAGSLSWAGLFNLFYWIDPSRGIAAAFATQLLPFNDAGVMDLFADFEREIYKTLSSG